DEDADFRADGPELRAAPHHVEIDAARLVALAPALVRVGVVEHGRDARRKVERARRFGNGAQPSAEPAQRRAELEKLRRLHLRKRKLHLAKKLRYSGTVRAFTPQPQQLADHPARIRLVRE